MDIRALLVSEHSKSLTRRIVSYIGEDRDRFKILMKIFLGDEPRLRQRSAWAMSEIAVGRPALIRPYLKKMLPRLREKDAHPAIARNILRALQFMDVPEKYEADLLDDCFHLMRSGLAPVAVRAFAITVASNICKKYPDLLNELRIVLGELSAAPQLPAIRHRIKKALKA